MPKEDDNCCNLIGIAYKTGTEANGMTDSPLDRLTAEYHAWMRENGVDLSNADESISLAVDVARAHLHDENMTDAQRAWLRDFVRRWEREQG